MIKKKKIDTSEMTKEQIEAIEKLEQQLHDLLKERPDFQDLQDKIEQIADEAGDDPEKRIKAINEFFVKHLRETFIPEMASISTATKEARKKIKKIQEESELASKESSSKKKLH